MTGVVGALVALAVVVGLVLVLAVRAHLRRFSRSAAALRTDVAAGLARLRAIRAERAATTSLATTSSATSPATTSFPQGVVVATSPIGGHGPHPRVRARS